MLTMLPTEMDARRPERTRQGLAMQWLQLLTAVLFTGAALFASGCSRGAPHLPDEAECAPPVPLREAGRYIVLPADELAQDELLRRHFSPAALQTANICGLAPLLRRYCEAPEGSRAREDLRHEVTERLAVVTLEITGTTAELDCEEERADQIADYLLDVAGGRVRMLTLLSILLGALGTVVTGTLALRGWSQKVYRSTGIAFGLVVASVGLTTLLASESQVRFPHARNPLGELYRAPDDPQVFARAVWLYLTQTDHPHRGPESLRNRLLKRWEESGELGAKSPAEQQRLKDLLFGAGGVYRASELSMRANFFDQLESQVNLMKHDLHHLAREFSEVDRPG